MTQAETTASFGYWVRRQRLALDLTQADLARAVGCATVTISKIERDERRPSRQMAGLLADKLGVGDDERERFLSIALGEKAVDRMPLAAEPLDSLLSEDRDAPRSNLAPASTPFVGRQEDLEYLARRLKDPTCRLLTLVGPGGFGKTRLAIQVGEILLEQEVLYADGVFFVALEGLENRDLVVPAIAAALNFTFYEQREQKKQLLDHLAAKRQLLILDNAEHILEGELVEEILGRAPEVKMVVTSREALNLQEEWFHPIDGLDVVDMETGSSEAAAADAIQLFQQCARRSRPGFELERELVHVQRICRLVDGAPLAIELAAAWLKTLPCAQVAQELERSLDFLSTSLRNIPARHRSMRAVLEQTWQYLTAEEQRVLRQLSVFVGGFRVDAAESVAKASLSTLASLVEKSMLQLGQDGRYRMHGLLRQLGTEKLADQPQELAAVQARHCDFYMAFLQDRRQSIAGREQIAVLEEVQEEVDNIRYAWSYAAEYGRLEDLGRALPCLFRFLWTRGRYEEGERLTAEALDALDAATLTDEHQSIQIVITARRAQFVAAGGDHQRAQSMIDEALASARQIGALPEQALCFFVSGMIAEHVGDWEGAVENWNAARKIYQSLNDKASTGETASRLAHAVWWLRGDLATGQKLAEEGRQLLHEIGDLSSTADAMDRAAVLQFGSGEIDDAEKRYQDSLALAREVGNRLVVARSIGGLGLVAWGRAQWELAIQLMKERLERMQELGHENELKQSMNMLCGINAHAGRYAEAMLLLETHPDMWRTPWTAQAHVGAGECEEAMSYLPQESAAKLDAGSTYNLAEYLIAWSMLLASECALVREDSSIDAVVSLTRGERTVKAIEILSLIRTYDRCQLITRVRAERLLVEFPGEKSARKSDVAQERHEDRSIEELAREMLAIRLG